MTKTDLQKKYYGLASKIILLFLMTMGFINCNRSLKHESCGFILQEFEVIDPQLKRLIWNIRDSLAVNEKLNEENIPIIEFRKKDSIFEVGFVNAEKTSVSEMYIFNENRRIVGYVEVENDLFLILSHISPQGRFFRNMCEFIAPAAGKQRFDYVFFPDNLYGSTPGRFPMTPLFDPVYSWYTYQDGQFILQEGYTLSKGIRD